VAVGYCRVSTDRQAESGAGLAAQCSAIEAEVARRGWELLGVFEDGGVSGATFTDDRPGFRDAMARIESREAGVLIVAKQDRAFRSLLDFAQVMDRQKREGWHLLALDTQVDTTTPVGRLVATVLAAAAEHELERGRERTRAALEAKRAQGVKLGRPRTVGAKTRSRIVELRSAGLTWQAVADALVDEGHPTGQGGRWQPRTVQRIHDAELPALLTRSVTRGDD
jgi:DNA invertase Pin-like site-specific DNA recombinase